MADKKAQPDFIPAQAEAPDFIPAEGEHQAAAPQAASAPLDLLQTAKDVGVGALKGAGSTANAIGKILIPDRLVSALGGKVPTEDQQASYFKPTNTPQAIGKGLEQTGEFFVPGPGEAELAAKSGTLAKLGKIGYQALKTGGLNKLQGGDFTTGAIGGAAGEGIAQGATALAPKLAESAMAPGKRLLKSIPEGVDIGNTALNKTTGIRPKAIVGQLDSQIAQQASDKAAMLHDAADEGMQLSLKEPRSIVASEQKAAMARNNPDYIKDVDALGDQLRTEHGPSGKPLMTAGKAPIKQGAGFTPVTVSAGEVPKVPVGIPEMVDPLRYDALRRGVDTAIGNFNPESAKAIAPTAKMVRGTMARTLHEAVPEIESADKELTQLIPTREAAWNTSFNPAVTRSLFEKLQRPTGALIGGLAGYHEGKDAGGLPGAIAGAATGLVGGNLLASPTGQMIIARGLKNYARPLIKGATGGLLQLDRNEK